MSEGGEQNGWLQIEVERGEQIALRRKQPWQRVHWACDGTMLFEGPDSARLGELSIPDEGKDGEKAGGRRRGEEEDERAVQFMAPRAAPRFEKDVIPGSKSSGRRVVAVAVAPSGRFAAAVLDNLRVLLWDKVGPPGEGFMGGEGCVGIHKKGWLEARLKKGDTREFPAHIPPPARIFHL